MGKRTALTGVYATWVYGIGPLPRASVSSLGTRPTVFGREPLLEAHVFDFDGDLYGQRITVEFVHKLRDEVRFDDLPALGEFDLIINATSAARHGGLPTLPTSLVGPRTQGLQSHHLAAGHAVSHARRPAQA